MFGLCSQALYYLILSLIVEICGILIIGFDAWFNIFKNNYIISIISCIIYLIIIQLLCYFNKSTMAWILFWITVILNLISLLNALGKNMPDFVKKELELKKSKDRTFKKDFDKSANTSSRNSCINTCNNNPNKPIDLDCNNYCDNTYDKMF